METVRSSTFSIRSSSNTNIRSQMEQTSPSWVGLTARSPGSATQGVSQEHGGQDTTRDIYTQTKIIKYLFRF